MDNEKALEILLGKDYKGDTLGKSESENLSPELFQLLNPGKQMPIRRPKEILEKSKESKETNATILKGANIYSTQADKKYVMTRDFPTKILVKASDLYTFEFKKQTFYVPVTSVEVDDDAEIIELKQKVKKRIEKSKEENKEESETVNIGLNYEQKIKDGLGLTRDKLPQINEENLDDFLIHFSDKAKVKKVKVKLKDLKFTQGELDSEKVLSIMKDEEEGWKTRKYIMSLDKYILDGHHSIAAGLEIDEDTEVDVYRVNVPMKQLIVRVNKMKISNNLDIDDNEIKKSLDILEKAYNEGKIKEKIYFEALEKAKNHKYIRREGTKGNYKYIYEEKDNQVKETKLAIEKAVLEGKLKDSKILKNKPNEDWPSSMSDELINEIKSWKTVSKSPYGNSFYSTLDKSWDFTSKGTIRVSDHWDFTSRGKKHCELGKPLSDEEKYNTWTMAQYNSKTGKYDVIKHYKFDRQKLDNYLVKLSDEARSREERDLTREENMTKANSKIEIGSFVRHERFGDGVVERVDYDENGEKKVARIKFPELESGSQSKLLLLRFAPLELIEKK